MKKTICLIIMLIVTLLNSDHARSISITPVPQEIPSAEGTQIQVQTPAFVRPSGPGKTEETIRQTGPGTNQPIQYPKVKAERTASEFELFISGTVPSEVSTNISQFGYDLFEEPVSKFTPPETVSVGPGYVLGPGDELKITIWGKVEGLWNVTVDRDGKISLPKIGVISVSGLTYMEMKDVLYKEISRYYTGFEMNVSISSLRTIRIYIVGNAQYPGAYTVSSLSTLVSALFQSGGPSKNGTMRDIQLKRNGETVVHFDMYDFLLKGDKTKDLRIQSEDVIFIPPVGPLAGIAGNIKRPAIYELKGEIKLLELIDMAGGLTSTAFKGRVQAQRIEDHQFRTLFEDDLLDMEKNTGKNFIVNDGDLVKVFSIVETNNTISLAGAVVNQGKYAINPGATRIKDVISKASGVLYYASDEAELTRVNVTQSGPVTELININISKALNEDPGHNITMEVNDYLFVRTVPEWNLYQKANIMGEVKFPGSYSLKKGEKLSSLIERAGGYTDNAYLRGAIFTRERVRALQQEDIARMAERLEMEMFSESSARVSTALSQEEITARRVEIEQKKKFIETLKKLTATGRMSIMLSHLRLLKGSEYDIELEEGDSLFIPKKNSVVNVMGSVMSRGSFVYIKDMDYKDFINMAGGYTRNSDKDNIYVLKVDGTAMKLDRGLFNWNDSRSRWEAAGFEIQEIEPGDSIVVPEKFEHTAWMRETKDLTQILYQIAVSAAVVIELLQ